MSDQKPNILFMFSDQHGAAFAGCYGDDIADTPNMDKLAANGAVFENAHCPSPLCIPSRMAMMAAQYPHDIGVYTNRDYLKSDTPTFTHALGVAGYRTALVGRMHFIGPDQLHGFEDRPVGDISVNWPGSPLIEFSDLNDARGTKGPTLRYSGIGKTTVHQYDRAVTKGACSYIDELATSKNDKPFFMTIGWYGPHSPFIALEDDYKHFEGHVPPPKLPEPNPDEEHGYLRAWREKGEFHDIPEDHTRRARTGYYANLRMIDRQIGKIIAQLEKNGLLDNTLIVYASDHGEQLGERGFWQKNTFYDHSVKVPIIVSWPGQIKAGQTRSEIVNLIDLAASFVAAGGGNPLPHGKGNSFLDLLTGKSTEWDNQTLSEFYGGLVSIETTAIANRMVRNERYKLNYYHGFPPELFDMLDDPDESRNLSSDAGFKEINDHLLSVIQVGWNSEQILTRIGRKALDVDLLKQWTKATKAEEEYRWFPEIAR